MLRFASRQVRGVLPILSEKLVLPACLQRGGRSLPAIQDRSLKVSRARLLQQRPQQPGEVLRDEQEQPRLVLHQGDVLRDRAGLHHHQPVSLLAGQVYDQLPERAAVS